MIEVIMIMICCTLFNQMGLCEAIETVIKHKLPILNCAKCLTFWSSLIYMILSTHDILLSLFISFVMSYLSLWVELFLGYMATIYNKKCDEIYTSKENKP